MIMKIKKLMLVVAAISLVAFGGLAGCKAPTIPNTPYDLEILFWESGLGREYIDRINVEFNKMHPEINIHLVSSADVSTVPLYASPATNTVDLYFVSLPTYLAHKEYLEPLNDVIGAAVDGGSLTIGDKIHGIAKRMKEDGSDDLYVIPYASTVNTLVYNADIFAANSSFFIPRTTNELINLANIIQDTSKPGGGNYVPFIFYNTYWRYITEAWIAQLDGVDSYFDMWSAVYTDIEGTRNENDVRAFTDYSLGKGKYEALNVLQKLVSRSSNIVYGTNIMSHIETQTRFLNGEAVMIPNGSWLENEMKNAKNHPNIRMMRPPVISALGTKLGITENQLAAAVAYVDGTANSSETAAATALPPAKLDAVRAARGIMHTELSGHTAFIPNYSNAKAAAKEYLKFYYSDAAMKIMQETTRMPIPVTLSQGEVDTASWSGFSKDAFAYSQSFTPIYTSLRSRIMYENGISSFSRNAPSSKFAYSQNVADMWDLSQYITEETKYWNNNWPIFKSGIGIN
ncbi:hypothetical protein FACS1894211_00200 [Clostridia bacterium]|nr:hypothetical protein FACS1894211_00200 [Clostridia bacterium]